MRGLKNNTELSSYGLTYGNKKDSHSQEKLNNLHGNRSRNQFADTAAVTNYHTSSKATISVNTSRNMKLPHLDEKKSKRNAHNLGNQSLQLSSFGSSSLQTLQHRGRVVADPSLFHLPTTNETTRLDEDYEEDDP